MEKLKALLSGSIIILLLATGCSELSSVTGPVPEEDTASVQDENISPLPEEEQEDEQEDEQQDEESDKKSEQQEVQITEIDFSDLSYGCGWDKDFPNPYKGLEFEEAPHWGICDQSVVNGMSDQVISPADNQYYVWNEELHTTVAYLSEPADTVSISTANYSSRRGGNEYASVLIAYDEEGNEIDRAVNDDFYRSPNNNSYYATVLTVTSKTGSKIHSIGISTYQGATYLDNLRIVVGSIDSTPPEINYTVVTDSLWAPNHKMILSITGISAVDDIDGSLTPTVNINSKEKETIGSDWEIIKNEDGTLDVWLKAERSGDSSGRVYTTTITAVDSSGNRSEETIETLVPHNPL